MRNRMIYSGILLMLIVGCTAGAFFFFWKDETGRVGPSRINISDDMLETGEYVISVAEVDSTGMFETRWTIRCIVEEVENSAWTEFSWSQDKSREYQIRFENERAPQTGVTDIFRVIVYLTAMVAATISIIFLRRKTYGGKL